MLFQLEDYIKATTEAYVKEKYNMGPLNMKYSVFYLYYSISKSGRGDRKHGKVQ